MKLSDYLNTDDLLVEIQNGYVDVKIHDTLPLVLFCHTKKATLAWRWNDITTKCRGLICTRGPMAGYLNGEIVARPFEKFFDLDTPGQPETSSALLNTMARPIVSDKLDGSLAIFWHYEGHWGVASKGSFDSVHAKWATTWFQQHVETYGSLVWPVGYTPVFEMIAESVQTHVVSYNGDEDLVLIALVNTATGEELPPMAVESYAKRNHLRCVAFYSMNLAGAVALDRENHEGFVFSFPRLGQAPVKIKVKHPTFKEHQRLVHGMTPKKVLELLKQDSRQTFAYLQEALPAHVYAAVTGWSLLYRQEYEAIRAHAGSLVTKVLEATSTRKEAAALLTEPANKEYAPICFLMLDQDPSYKQVIWKLVGKRVKIHSQIEPEVEGD